MSTIQKIKSFLLENKTTKQTVAKNTFWLTSSEASSRILRMILIIYAARILGVSGWGTFSYAISIGSILMIFSDMGLSGLITREVAQKEEDHKSFITAALLIKSIILSVSALLVIFISPYISHISAAQTLFPIIAAILFFDSMRDIGFALTRAFEKMEWEMIIKATMNFIILIFGIILIKIRPDPESLAIAYATGSAIGTVSLLTILRKDIKNLISKVDKSTIQFVLKTTWPFAVIILTGNIMSNTDIYMLGIWKNSTEIGLYSSAQKIQQFILIIPAIIATVAFPTISRLANKDNWRLRMILERTMSLNMLIGIPIVLGGSLLADQIILSIFGPEYLRAIPSLRILIIMLLASFSLVLLSNAIFAYNKQKNLMFAYLFGIIANIFINFLLIPKFGAAGAALATLLSSTVITLIIWIKMKAINNFEVFSKLKKIFLSSLIMTLSVLIMKYLKVNIILNITFSSLIYFGCLLLVKEPIIKELQDILKLKNNNSSLQQ